jgi:subtilisin family serine protease
VLGLGATVGVCVVSTGLDHNDHPVYMSAWGTSMASPHVAGTAALLWARHPTASVGEVRQALLSGVDRRPSLVGRTVTGGRLNARRALEELAR